MYKFSNKSLEYLEGVHPDLVNVMKHALVISSLDFKITEGVRTLERQKLLYAEHKTKKLDSTHLVQSTGYGHAVDIVPYPVNWEIPSFCVIAESIRKVAIEDNIKIRWGGFWGILNNTSKPCEKLVEDYAKERKQKGFSLFIDAPHFEIIL